MKKYDSYNPDITTHNSVAIANYFIGLNRKHGKKGFTLMQLLKLSYIAHGFKLALSDEALANEAVQAWRYGPVFFRLYEEFKRESHEIKNFAMDLDEATNTLYPAQSGFSTGEKKIMEIVHDIYGDIDGWRLSSLTHAKSTPWYKVREKDKAQGIYGSTLPNDDIKEYFQKEVINKYIK